MSGTGSLGAGQMMPPDGGMEFNRAAFQSKRLFTRIRTMIPVRVVKVYKQDGKTTATRGEVAGAGYIDAQPCVSMVDGKSQKMDHVTIYHIPYTRIYGGDASIINDPVVNDIGYIHVSDRDISAFKDQIKQGSTQLVLPGSQRRHDLSDTLYVGGVLNNTPKQWITFTDTGIVIHDVNKNEIILDNSGSITLKPANNTVVIKGDLHATGAVIAGYGGGDQVGLQTHTHQNSGGTGNSGTPNAGT